MPESVGIEFERSRLALEAALSDEAAALLAESLIELRVLGADAALLGAIVRRLSLLAPRLTGPGGLAAWLTAVREVALQARHCTLALLESSDEVLRHGSPAELLMWARLGLRHGRVRRSPAESDAALARGTSNSARASRPSRSRRAASASTRHRQGARLSHLLRALFDVAPTLCCRSITGCRRGGLHLQSRPAPAGGRPRAARRGGARLVRRGGGARGGAPAPLGAPDRRGTSKPSRWRSSACSRTRAWRRWRRANCRACAGSGSACTRAGRRRATASSRCWSGCRVACWTTATRTRTHGSSRHAGCSSKPPTVAARRRSSRLPSCATWRPSSATTSARCGCSSTTGNTSSSRPTATTTRICGCRRTKPRRSSW